MFAFAIWDERRRLLFAARDRIGIKPFYYSVDRERFAFASKAKSLIAILGVNQELNMPALADYLRHGYVLAPRTLFRRVLKLPPQTASGPHHYGSAAASGFGVIGKFRWRNPVN
jgi:asparagine synthase (glutamine-hydrolysing)